MAGVPALICAHADLARVFGRNAVMHVAGGIHLRLDLGVVVTVVRRHVIIRLHIRRAVGRPVGLVHCGASTCHTKADRGLSIFVLSWLNICLATVDHRDIFSSAACLLRLCRVLWRRLLLLLLGTFYFFRCRLEPSVLHIMVRFPEMLTFTHAERCVTSDIEGRFFNCACQPSVNLWNRLFMVFKVLL